MLVHPLARCNLRNSAPEHATIIISVELRLNKMETDFVFDQEDEAVLRFEENNFVEIHRDQGKPTNVT